MEISKIIKSGDEVRVSTGNEHFISKIFDVTGEASFLVNRQIGISAMQAGTEYSVVCVNDRGMFLFKAEVVGLHESPPTIELKIIGDYVKLQRRSTFRVRECLPVRVLEFNNSATVDWVDTTTANISESGVLLRYTKHCAPGQRMKLVIHINRLGMDVYLPAMNGKVVRCIKTESKDYGYLVGIAFDEVPERARNEIIKFVVLSQRDQMSGSRIKRYLNYG